MRGKIYDEECSTVIEDATAPQHALSPYVSPPKVSNKAFFDVTTLLAYVSEVVNGPLDRDSEDPVIQQQIEGERANSSIPLFKEFLEGPWNICCCAL